MVPPRGALPACRNRTGNAPRKRSYFKGIAAKMSSQYVAVAETGPGQEGLERSVQKQMAGARSASRTQASFFMPETLMTPRGAGLTDGGESKAIRKRRSAGSSAWNGPAMIDASIERINPQLRCRTPGANWIYPAEHTKREVFNPDTTHNPCTFTARETIKCVPLAPGLKLLF